MGYIFALMYGIALLYALKFKWEAATRLLICICFFQNIVLVILSNFMTSSFQFTIIALEKELYIVLYMAIRIIKNRKISKKTMFCLVSILILLIFTIISDEGTSIGRLASFRQLYLPFMFFIYGDTAKLDRNSINKIINTYIKCCLVASVFGFVELSLGDRFWVNIGFNSYVKLKGVERGMRADGLLRSFSTYDLGFLIRRMASTLVDPVILGQLLAVGFLLSVFVKDVFIKKKDRFISILIIGTALVMTLAKGGIVIAVIGSCILLKQVSNNKILSYLCSAILVIAIPLFISFGYENDTSVVNHMEGMISGVHSLFINPYGYGIGSSGNMALKGGVFASELANAGAESFIGSMIVQTGIVGVFLYIIFWYMLFSYKSHIRTENLEKVCLTLNLCLLIVAFFNNTAISFTSCYIFFVIYPVVVKNNTNLRRPAMKSQV